MKRAPKRAAPARVRGAASAEFAVTFVLFFSLVAGAVEVSRLMLFMGTAVEATRLGARVMRPRPRIAYQELP